MDSYFASLFPIALGLAASLALGQLAGRVGLPRVTVYLLVGLALGPHALLRWLGPEGPWSGVLLGPATAEPLRAAERLAIGFILFGIGGEFRIPALRRMGPRVLWIAGGQAGAVALGVAAAVGAATGDWRLALVAPALAIASAPSATLVTLREVEAEGPASRALILSVGLDNLAALLLFPLLLVAAFGVGDPGEATGRAAFALLLGAGIGLGASVWLERLSGRRETVILGLGVVLAVLGAVNALAPGASGLGMLGCFAAGAAMANGSPHSPTLFRYLENTVYPLYVLFFLGAGRDLHVEALAGLGLLGALFIAARAAGKLGGTWLGLRAAGWRDEMPPWLGAGLLCQAGIALGLVGALEEAAPAATADLRHVVVASVVVFELVGPWAVRRTVIAAGEVKLANLVSLRRPRERVGPLRWVLIELGRNLGWTPSDASGGGAGPTVRHAVRRRPRVVRVDMPFHQLLRALSEGGSDLMPVVDGDGAFRGVLSFGEVKNALYDPALRDLVIAEDLMEGLSDPLDPDDPIASALEHMDHHGAHSWPVVENGRLLGMVSRSDLYGLVHRGLGS